MGSQEENSSVSVAENRVAVVGNSCLHHLFDGVEAGQAEDRCSPQAAVRWQQAEAGVGAAGDHEDPAGRPQHQRRQHRGLSGELLQVGKDVKTERGREEDQMNKIYLGGKEYIC